VAKSFNEWISLKESTIWEKHKELPSLFTSTHYALPKPEQLDEFQKYPHLTAEDIRQGFGYTIVGRGVSSPDNMQKIVRSIEMLIDRYPERETYKEALALAKEEAKVKLERWRQGVVFP
jgi:hypothetical protein